MGIPRLGARLKEHAKRKTFKPQTAPDGVGGPLSLSPNAFHSYAIIDGPGLAHHVYYRLSNRKASTHVSYRAWVDGAIAWLDQLSSFGFRVEAVIFDGALPETKRSTRIARLQASAQRLFNYRSSGSSARALITPEVGHEFLPPPFLVAAVMEGLLSSAYAGVTVAVPGEADPYCVVAACALADSRESPRPVSIFSDDSDLLVYDGLGSVGIITLRDMQMEVGDFLNIEEYYPSEIAHAASITLTSLLKPAFFMSQDTHCTLKEAARRVTSTDLTHHPGFKSFSALFKTEDEVTEWAGLQADSIARRTLAKRDARFAELVTQLERIEVSSSAFAPSPSTAIPIFLPFLIGDPSRASAWHVAADLRLLAYSVLLHRALSSQIATTMTHLEEYKRAGARVTATALMPWTASETTRRLEELTVHIHDVRRWAAADTADQKPDDQSPHARLNDVQTCRYLVLQLTLQYAQAPVSHTPSPSRQKKQKQQQPSQQPRLHPTRPDILALVTDTPTDAKWPFLHLAAQYQAAYYSLRMLRQAVEYRPSNRLRQSVLVKRVDVEDQARQPGSTTTDVKQDLDRACTAAAEELARWAGVAEFFDASSAGSVELWSGLIDGLLGSTEVEEESSMNGGGQDERKRLQGEDGRKRQKRRQHETTNPFAMLENDE